MFLQNSVKLVINQLLPSVKYEKLNPIQVAWANKTAHKSEEPMMSSNSRIPSRSRHTKHTSHNMSPIRQKSSHADEYCARAALSNARCDHDLWPIPALGHLLQALLATVFRRAQPLSLLHEPKRPSESSSVSVLSTRSRQHGAPAASRAQRVRGCPLSRRLLLVLTMKGGIERHPSWAVLPAGWPSFKVTRPGLVLSGLGLVFIQLD